MRNLWIECDPKKGYKPNDEDFIEFSRQIYESLDIDPVYPLLKNYFDLREFTEEERVFGSFIYSTIYNLYWTLALLEEHRKELTFETLSESPLLDRIKCGTDRRGIAFYGVRNAFKDFVNFFSEKSLYQFITEPLTPDGKKNYIILRDHIQKIPHYGKWGTYKIIDVLTHSAGLNINCTDWWTKGRAFGGKQLVVDWEMGMEYRLGKNLKETNEIVEMIDKFSDRWTERFQRVINKSITYDQSETMACKYHALYGGTYYAGHDIDKMQEEPKQKYSKALDDLFFYLREITFDKKYLGEHQGWKGVRRELKGKLYKPRRVMVFSSIVSKQNQEGGMVTEDILYVTPYAYTVKKTVDKSFPSKINKLASQGKLKRCIFPIEPFHYREVKRHATQEAIEACMENNIPFTIETKREIPDWAIKALNSHRENKAVIYISCLDDKRWKFLHPKKKETSDVENLLENFYNAFQSGANVGLRVSPIVPGVITIEDIFLVINRVYNWVSRIDLEFTKLSQSEYERIVKSFESVAEFYENADGEWTVKQDVEERVTNQIQDFLEASGKEFHCYNVVGK